MLMINKKAMLKPLVIASLLGGLSGCSLLSVDEPPVAKQGKNLADYDGDGVIAARDRCEATPQTAVIDNDGCPDYVHRDNSQDVHVLFANDSTVIPSTYYSQFDTVKAFLDAYPDTSIELHGYASPVGSRAHNEYLAKTRADNVRQALIESGIDANRIRSIGYGDSDPVAAEDHEESMRLSRRVTASVVGQNTNVIEKWTVFTTRNK